MLLSKPSDEQRRNLPLLCEFCRAQNNRERGNAIMDAHKTHSEKPLPVCDTPVSPVVWRQRCLQMKDHFLQTLDDDATFILHVELLDFHEISWVFLHQSVPLIRFTATYCGKEAPDK